jgi:hypothetical protein
VATFRPGSSSTAITCWWSSTTTPRKPSATAADLGDGTVLAVSATGAVTRVATDGEQPRFAGNRIV